VVAPCPYARADGEDADDGDETEEVDRAHHLLEDGQAGQAALVGLDPGIVGELNDLFCEICCERFD
jgi:hypothetical protein